MFTQTLLPRVFGLAPGIDFPQALIQGLFLRDTLISPEQTARIEILVNTHRMARRMREILDTGPARLLPNIRVISDLGHDFAAADLPPAVPYLRRRLELTRLVSALLSAQPDLAPSAALFDLADSLATLMDEMQSEGVSPATIAALDVSDQSGHWQRALKFVSLVERYFGPDSETAPDSQTRQRLVIKRMIARWQAAPPRHPVIVAGSTGSQGTTRLLMQAVARLPQGAIVLPGYDFDMPDSAWALLDDAMASEDHPQFRFRRLLDDLGLRPRDVTRWGDTPAPNPARNRLISLALRPAPLTDQWMVEGPRLSDITAATAEISLLEAPSPRVEALAIALKLRECVELGKTAALISPDRTLTRQVTAALDQWRIEPDDSAGQPLGLSPPGRFLRHISGLFGLKLTTEMLLELLKHPLTNTGAQARGLHLLWTRELELDLRRNGPPFPRLENLQNWAAKKKSDDGRMAWALWLGDLLGGLGHLKARPLSDHIYHHRALAEALSAGPDQDGTGTLWEKPAGQEAKRYMDELRDESALGSTLSCADYVALFRSILNRGEVRDPTRPHPDIKIWGTLEARVQGTDLVILGGLNDGTWPQLPPPDPWLNREMRKSAGLLLPERRIGLAAHDFQQAICAQQVLLTRAVRNNESETIPSRWINRLTNLLAGLEDNGGPASLATMRHKGRALLDRAKTLEHISDYAAPAPRPSPCPPVSARPRHLSVTRIKTLIRDPYAIYAEFVLRLRPLNAIRQQADAPLRGTVVHKIFERFIAERGPESHAAARKRLLHIADEILMVDAPWPTARRIWRAKLARVADWFLETEQTRSRMGVSVGQEIFGKIRIPALDFTLSAKADRFDRTQSGAIVIYDYKTGTPPSPQEQKYFDKQLLLTAAMVERGAFELLGTAHVDAATYIGLGASPKIVPAPLEDFPQNQVWAELETLIDHYNNADQGYTSCRAMQKVKYGSEYQHLARCGEWDTSQMPKAEVLK